MRRKGEIPSPPAWRRYLRLWGPDSDADLRDELELHLELRTEELIEKGWQPGAARQEARRSLGDLDSIRRQCRAIASRGQRRERRQELISGLGNDLRQAARRLAARPAMAIVVILSLAIGIGANTTMFSLVQAVLLDRLPVQAPEELVLFNWVTEGSLESTVTRVSITGTIRDTKGGGTASTSFSRSLFERFSKHASTSGSGPLDSVFAFTELYRLNLNLGDKVEMGNGLLVSGGYCSGLGLTASAGRLLTPADDRPESAPVVVLSHGFWRSRLGADPDIVGRDVRLNGLPFTVVGVAPAGFHGTLQVGSSPPVLVPLVWARSLWRSDRVDSPRSFWLQIMGRLAPGVRRSQAEPLLDTVLQHGLEQDLGITQSGEAGRAALRLELSPGDRGLEEDREELVEPLAIAQVVVAAILLIACVNAATLLLARGEERRREMAVRQSLGARWGRLARLLLMESLLLAVLAGGVGLLLSLLASAALPAMLAGLNGAPTGLELGPDLPVLSFCLVVTLLTGLLCGLVPALRLCGMRPAAALKPAAGATRPGYRLAPGRALVVVQMALSLVLLITAGLFLRTLHNLQSVELGFDPEGVVLFSVDPTLNGYHDERLLQLYEGMQDRLRDAPGVIAVGMTPYPPASGSGSWLWLHLPDGERTTAYIALTDSGFFDTLRIPIAAGRPLQASDDAAAPPVALVNRHLADRLGNDAVGQRIRLGGGEMIFEVSIVGVVEDIRDVGLRGDPQLSVFLPFRQRMEHVEAMTFLLRGNLPGDELLTAAREVVAEIDPNLPLYGAGLLADQVGDAVIEERVFTLLCSLGAVLALVLACIGLYGTLTFAVSLRTTELGVRVALGARGADIVRSVMREMVLVAAGVTIGLASAWLVTRVLASRLFQLSASDPLTITGATLLLVAVAAVTTYLPARRAARIDPVQVLRFE